MFQLFNDIIKGKLRPHLINDSNIEVLRELQSFELIIDEDENGKTFESNSEWFNHCFDQYQDIIIGTDKNNPNIKTFQIPADESLFDIYDFEITPPQDEKSEIYLTLIERESDLIKYKIGEFIKNSNNIKKNEVFALKNIQILKDLAEQLRIYKQKQGKDDPLNHDFVYYALKYYIIDIIQYIQRTFSPYINQKVEDKFKLKYDLFHEEFPRIPLLTIMQLLPKDEELEDLKKDFRAFDRESRRKTSAAEFFMEHYHSWYKGFSKDIQIKKYNKVLHFWNELLITNKLSTCIAGIWRNEPEIEQKLIRLLENKIKFLEKEVENQNVKNNNSDERIIADHISSKLNGGLTVYNFFDLLISEELSSLDIDNYIQNLTDNFSLKKLKKLLHDIEFCFSLEKEERETEITSEEIEQAITELKKQGREVPITKHPPLKGKNGIVFSEGHDSLNLEKLIYPYEYFSIYIAIGEIKHLIKEKENVPSPSEELKKPELLDKIISFNKTMNYEKNMTLKPNDGLSVSDFFNSVLSGVLGELEIDNYIERITNNFSKDKLAKLLYDIEFWLFVDRDERESEITHDDIDIKLKTLKDRNEEIPYHIHPEFKDDKGEIVHEEMKILDIEKLFYPHTYFTIYDLIAKIKHHINDSENISLPQVEKVKTKIERPWDSFHDKFNIVKFEEEGIAELERWYNKYGKLVFQNIAAKGITAFLSKNDTRSFISLLGYRVDVNLNSFFEKYFDHCLPFLIKNENEGTPTEDDRLSKNQLIQIHLDNEEQLYSQSELYFRELRNDYQIPTIQTIEKAALYYPKWLKETYLKEDIQNLSNEFQSNSTEKPLGSKSFKSNKVVKTEKIIIPFQKYLILEDYNELDHRINKEQIKLANICKRVFGTIKSPTIYAVMFCILSDNKIITVLPNYQADFFKSWYIFLKVQIPNSLECIYKPLRKFKDYIDLNDGILNNNKDKDLKDYLKKKNEFEKEYLKYLNVNKLKKQKL